MDSRSQPGMTKLGRGGDGGAGMTSLRHPRASGDPCPPGFPVGAGNNEAGPGMTRLVVILAQAGIHASPQARRSLRTPSGSPVLRVLGLGEEQPAFGQQAGGLHLASRNTCASRERVAHCNSTQRLWWNPAGHRLAQRDF